MYSHAYVTSAQKRTHVDHWNMPNHHTSTLYLERRQAQPSLILSQDMPMNVMFSDAPMTPRGYGTNKTKINIECSQCLSRTYTMYMFNICSRYIEHILHIHWMYSVSPSILPFQCEPPILYPSWDSSVGRAVDCHVTGPGFNTHSTWLGVYSAFHPSVRR